MKIKKRNIIISMLFFLLVGCATTTNLKIIDSTGREEPNPHYVLQSLSTQLIATFYYASMSEIKDTDGTIIYRPTYLPMNKIYKALPTTRLYLIIEVSNPNKIEYKFWSETMIVYWNGEDNKTFTSSLLAKSKVDYRQFVFNMPISETIKDASYGVNLFDNSGKILMHLGDFHYKIQKEKGGEMIEYFQ